MRILHVATFNTTHVGEYDYSGNLTSDVTSIKIYQRTWETWISWVTLLDARR